MWFINGATCTPADKSGCAQVATVRVSADPADVTVVAATNTLYVASTYDNTGSVTGTVSVVGVATCNAGNRSGCRSQAPPQVPAGADPVSTAFDPASNKVYVTNENANTLSVLAAGSCNAARQAGCKARPLTVAVGSKPAWIVINTALDTVYVVDSGDNNLLLLTAT